MKTNVNVIKKLARLGVIDVEPVKYKKEGDIIIKNDIDVEQRVILEGISDEDLPLMIEAEKLATLKYIKSVVKRYVIGCGIVVGIWLLFFLIELGDKL